MKRTRRNLLMSLFVALVGGAIWLFFAPRDPLFHGKPESEWIEQLSAGRCSHAQGPVEQWQEFGPDGVRVLARALNNANRPLERAYRNAWQRMDSALPRGVVRLLPSPRNDSTRMTRQCVTYLLWRLGDGAKIAAQVLARALHDEDPAVRKHAIYFFTAGGAGGESALLNQMLEKEKRKLLPNILRSVQEDDTSKFGAAVALGYFPEQRDIVAPVLVNVLFEEGLRTIPVEQWTNSIPDPGAWSSPVYVAARESLKRIAPDAEWAKRLLKQKVESEAAANQGVQK